MSRRSITNLTGRSSQISTRNLTSVNGNIAVNNIKTNNNKQTSDDANNGKNARAVKSTTGKGIKRPANAKSAITKKRIKCVTFAKRVTTIPSPTNNPAAIATLSASSVISSTVLANTRSTNTKTRSTSTVSTNAVSASTVSTNRKRIRRSGDEKTATSKKKAKPATTTLLPPSMASSTVSRNTLGQGVRLKATDYQKSCEDLSKYLLGKRLVTCVLDEKGDACRVSGRIVETEAYLGGADKASHSYNGKMTERTEAMYMDPGTAYVYNIYGTQCCLNVSSLGPGAAVLIRSLEPMEGIDIMKRKRSAKLKSSAEVIQLCSGPSKLTQAFGIAKCTYNKLDLPTSTSLWIEDHPADPVVNKNSIVTSARIGMGKSTEEWATEPLRFYIWGCKFVSVRDKKAESQQSMF